MLSSCSVFLAPAFTLQLRPRSLVLERGRDSSLQAVFSTPSGSSVTEQGDNRDHQRAGVTSLDHSEPGIAFVVSSSARSRVTQGAARLLSYCWSRLPKKSRNSPTEDMLKPISNKRHLGCETRKFPEVILQQHSPHAPGASSASPKIHFSHLYISNLNFRSHFR